MCFYNQKHKDDFEGGIPLIHKHDFEGASPPIMILIVFLWRLWNSKVHQNIISYSQSIISLALSHDVCVTFMESTDEIHFYIK